MSKNRPTKHKRDCMKKKDLSFCYEMQFRPEGIRFTQIETPHSVLIQLDVEDAGRFLWDVGAAFHKLPLDEQIKVYDRCILLFADHLLKNPSEANKYALSDEALDYFSYLSGDKSEHDQEPLFSALLDEKSTKH